MNSYSGSDNPNWEFADSFTTVRGSHTIGLGIDFRRWHLIRNLDDDFYGDWSFSGKTVQTNYEAVSSTNAASSCTNPASALNGGHPLCGTGNGIADMLTGYYSGVGGFVPGPLSPANQAGNPQDHVFNYVGPYAEDDWKITPKFSINYGLRWQLSGITTFQTGFPYGISGADPLGLSGSVAQRANYVPGCSVHANLTKSFQRINPDCFTNPPLGTFGTSSRNFLRQPGIDNWDMAIGKTFTLYERLAFSFKMDTFNTFNHHQYSGDVGGLIVAGSGGNNTISNSVGAATFGRITGASSPRILQFSGKITF